MPVSFIANKTKEVVLNLTINFFIKAWKGREYFKIFTAISIFTIWITLFTLKLQTAFFFSKFMNINLSFRQAQDFYNAFRRPTEKIIDEKLKELDKLLNVGETEKYDCDYLIQYMEWEENKNPKKLTSKVVMARAFSKTLGFGINVKDGQDAMLKNYGRTGAGYTPEVEINLLETTGVKPDEKSTTQYFNEAGEGVYKMFIEVSNDDRTGKKYWGGYTFKVDHFYGSTIIDENGYRIARFVILMDKKCSAKIHKQDGLRIIQEIADVVKFEAQAINIVLTPEDMERIKILSVK